MMRRARFEHFIGFTVLAWLGALEEIFIAAPALGLAEALLKEMVRKRHMGPARPDPWRLPLSRSASSIRLRSVTSVFVPNHWSTFPSASFRGKTRVRNGRKIPSAPRRGNSISNICPVAIEDLHCFSTFGSTAGSCTFCQPQPSICSGVVPV